MPDWSVLEGDVVDVARRLLGCRLVREVDGQRLVATIVETEAYHQSDAASHSYKGQTPRTEVMFGSAGRLYVYFTYGMHYCMNIVTGKAGEGSAVLLRAAEPIEGMELMRQRRRGVADTQLTNGPAKLCQAFAIDATYNGHDMAQPPFQLIVAPQLPEARIQAATRIGITKDAHRLWRFYDTQSAYVSRR